LTSASPETALVRVLVADDHEPTRKDVMSALKRDGRFDVCAEAADAAAAVARAMEERPDLVLLDIRMPGSGLRALWEISARLPTTRIVMLTVSEEDSDLFAALRAGAHGYLLKDIDPRRLPEALFDVNPRRRSVPESSELDARLTSREWQVLDLLARDNTTAEIAGRLVLSPSAVRAHIAAIVKKFDARDRNEAVELFRRRSGI
jgi:DNA-binding NarL/FixJ family response regulator